MKYIIASLALGLLMAFTTLQKKKKVIFFGDSITQAGVQPGGYIKRVDSMSAAAGKSAEYEFQGAGIGGNKVYDLYLRLESDVLDKKPDLVFIYVGVNDVWHKRLAGTGTDADKFQRFYQALIDKIKAAGAKLVLVTPAAIGEKNDFSNEQDGDLNRYSGFIRELASKNNLAIVDLRKIFHDYEVANNPKNLEKGILTTDGVHLNAEGNQLVADHFWKAVQAAK
ncbi:MAG: G-D-S-L family lipolytic protein [Chitinophagaceae bacterium]|nr:MAG: G-D-S-L family lipolytic protein [Chitinophagaceae bacterium]